MSLNKRSIHCIISHSSKIYLQMEAVVVWKSLLCFPWIFFLFAIWTQTGKVITSDTRKRKGSIHVNKIMEKKLASCNPPTSHLERLYLSRQGLYLENKAIDDTTVITIEAMNHNILVSKVVTHFVILLYSC